VSAPRVTILSDFGTVDGYAAAMAGVIAAAAPRSIIDHASHDIPPGEVLTAGLTLSRYAFLYPPGTVHLVVVDPGVGTGRRALAAAAGGRLFVAPDNGVLTRVLRQSDDWTLVRLDGLPSDRSISATFHGRDIFAPAAGRLAAGEPLESLGREIDDPVLLPEREPRREGPEVVGEVIQVDRFGNLITNVPADWLAPAAAVSVEGRLVGPVRRTYGDVEPGTLVALVGSLDLLEVSVRNGDAAARLEAGRGARVTVKV